MEEYDDLFNQYFKDYEFESEKQKESARLVFNELMDSFKNVNTDIDLSESIKEFPMVQNSSDVDELVNKYDLNLLDLKIVKSNKNYMVIESWQSEEEGYNMDVTYVLNQNSFLTKDQKSKEMIIDNITKNDMFTDSEINEYINMLSKEEQISYYKNKIEECVEVENYEKAAEFRDILNSI